MTLWYIPVILFCYLITPIVCRKRFAWRLFSALVLFSILLILKKLIPTIDWRFHYNMLFYLIGLVSAPFFDWKFEKAAFVQWLVVLLFIGLLVLTHFYSPNVHIRRLFSGIGVFAFLFVCEWFSNLVFKKESALSRIIMNISYASMVCYMYHRLFFWAGELFWNPATRLVKWFYMVGCVFLMMLLVSFYIQKIYDSIIDKTIKK